MDYLCAQNETPRLRPWPPGIANGVEWRSQALAEFRHAVHVASFLPSLVWTCPSFWSI
jgi:hypothetical protein